MPKEKKKREPGSFEVNVVVNIESHIIVLITPVPHLIKLRKRDSVLNFETEKDDVDFIFFKGKTNSR